MLQKPELNEDNTLAVTELLHQAWCHLCTVDSQHSFSGV